MANENVFPAIIKAEYQPGNAFPKMVQDATASAERIKRQFESDFAQMGQVVKDALTKPLTAAGSLDLGVGQYKAAADAAAMHARGLKEIADAARRVADSDPLSPALRRQAQAASAAALEADKLSREAAKEALNMDRLQSELDQTASSTQRLASAQRGMVASSAGSRQAYVGLGQQIADVAVQAQMGTNAFVILGQQGSQLAGQMAYAGGVAGRVAGFFAGPWGAALLGAVSIVGLLATRMGDAADATDDAGDAASDFANRQLDLSNFIDKTTGRLIEQNGVLRENAILLRQGEISKKKNSILEHKEAVFDLASRAAGSGVQQSLTGREGITVAQTPDTAISGAIKRANGNAFALQRELKSLNNPKLKGIIDQISQLNAQSILSARDIKKLGLENVAIAGGPVDKSLLDDKRKRGVRSRKGPSAETIADREFAATEFGQDARDKIAGIRDRFSDGPTQLQQQAAALRELADIQTDLEKRRPPKLDEYLAQLAQARKIVEGSLSKPFADMLATAREQAAVDDLLIDGRELEADILGRTLTLAKQKGGVTQAEVETIAEIVTQERLRSIEIDRQRQKQAEQLALIDQTQANLRDTVGELLNGKGIGAIGNLVSRQFDGYVSSLTDQISESLFGNTFREQRLKALGLDKVDEAGKAMASSIIATAKELDILRDSARGASSAVAGKVANDNRAFPDSGFGQIAVAIANAQSGITVNGRKPITTGDLVKALGKEVFGEKLAKDIGNAVESAMRGAAYGQAGAGLVSSLGVKTSKTGGQIGGALGEAAFKKLAPEMFKKLGDFAGPLGSIAGGIVGGLVGGLFKKTPKGNVTITGSGVSTSGSKSVQGGLNSLGSGIQNSIARIAEQLNGDVGNYSVGIRQKGKSFYVGGQKFADEASASQAALLSAIQNGAVQGIKAGAQRLLSAGKDLDAQLQKAVKFQSVFDRLDAFKNPTGAAINSLNREFGSLIKIFNEAGASAQELASLEELYGLERAKVIKEASDSLTGSLKSLIEDLTKGDSGLSLRDRLSNIRADFNPLANTIRSGGTVDYDKFSELARQLIEVQREISGSQSDYFSTFDEVLGLSRQALQGQQNVVSIGSNTGSPFSGDAAPSNIATPIVGAIGQMSGDIVAGLAAVQAQIAALGRLSSGGAGSERTSLAIGGGNYF